MVKLFPANAQRGQHVRQHLPQLLSPLGHRRARLLHGSLALCKYFFLFWATSKSGTLSFYLTVVRKIFY